MGLFESLDEGVTAFLGQWDVYTTALATLLAIVVTYRITNSRDPDIHPMILAKQASPSSIRHEGQSAVYRSHAAPHSMPLNGGLNIKDPGAAKWSRGRDGDLRDVWRSVAGELEGGSASGKGKILTVLGSENVIDHKIEDITRQINLIGQYIEEQGGIRVAVYLPNSVEFLATLFACSFYSNLTTVLIPFNVSEQELISMLRRSAADTVVTIPGAFPFDAVVKSYPSLRQLIWVVDQGSNHMDWDEVPEGSGSSVNVATWQDIVRDAPAAAGLELPVAKPEENKTTPNSPSDVITFWRGQAGETEEMVRFTQANLVAGIASQIQAVPVKERLTAADLFLPADPLTNSSTLVLTLAALHSHSSVALNTVAGESPDLYLATQGVAPTVVVASPGTLKRTHTESVGKLTSPLARLSHALSTRVVAQDGVLAPSNLLSGFASSARPQIGTATPGKLRVLYTAERAGAGTSLLSPSELSDLRILTGARVVYALTSAKVSGAVTQTAFYDYRVTEGQTTHFGAPLSGTEILFKDKGAHKTTDESITGEIYVRGPCVAGGESGLGVVGKLNRDNTLSYA